jgi:hypothetical protein
MHCNCGLRQPELVQPEEVLLVLMHQGDSTAPWWLNMAAVSCWQQQLLVQHY